MAPKIATMKAPPRERKKFAVPVAVPSLDAARTAFWIATMVTGSSVPRPTLMIASMISTATMERRLGRGGEEPGGRHGDEKAGDRAARL